LREQGVLVRKRTDSLEAYDTFLRGVEYFYRFTKEGNAEARPLFEKTIALDPQYAEAYAWLGWTYLMAWIQQWDPDPQKSYSVARGCFSSIAAEARFNSCSQRRTRSWVWMRARMPA
jgi:Tetratricopeptide repeat